MVNTNAEIAHEVVWMDKQFATVYLEFKDSDDGRTDYDLLVTGTVGGLNARTLEPNSGPFCCIPELAPERGFLQCGKTATSDVWPIAQLQAHPSRICRCA